MDVWGKSFHSWGIVLCTIATLGSLVSGAKASQWVPLDLGLNESQVLTLDANITESQTVVVGTPQALYQMDFEKTTDVKSLHSQVFATLNTDAFLNDIFLTSTDFNFALAATATGLFQFHLDGSTLSPLITPTRNQNIFSSVVFQNDSFFSTDRGVFRWSEDQSSAIRFFPRIFDEAVYQMVATEEVLYFVTPQDVWQWQSGSHPQVVYHSSVTTDSSQNTQSIKYFSTSNHPRWTRLVVSDEGLFYQSQNETEWVRLGSPGVSLDRIKDIEVFNDDVCIATEKGVLCYSASEQWRALDSGLTSRKVNDLLVLNDTQMLAATHYGVFMWGSEFTAQSAAYIREDWKSYFVDDPTIQQVHQWAIEFARVDNHKIEKWEQGSKKRAWYPSVDIGLDGGQDWDESDSLWGSSSSGGTHYVGPDDKSSGGNLDWDVQLSWDLADWVWSTDMTTIDNRAKLMIDQREDILDQVTRLYYERQRVYLKMKQVETQDVVLAQEHELRFEELTALLDGMTGGNFSLAISK